MKKIILGCTSLLVTALWCGQVAAWSHSGRFGGSFSGGGGSWSASGARGGSASGGGGSWSAEGFRGGSASGGGGSWSGTDRWGGSASHTYGDPGTSVTNRYGTSATVYRRPYYPGYHSPTVVDHYGYGCYSCGGWGAAAAGAAVGIATGAAIASADSSEDTSEAYSSGYAAGSAASSSTSTDYAMGATYAKLPSGCAERKESGGTYYHCGATWFSPSFGANGVYYRVVPPPA